MECCLVCDADSGERTGTSIRLELDLVDVGARARVVREAAAPHGDRARRPGAGRPPPRMPKGHDIDEIVDLVVQGITEGRSALVADLKSGTVTLS